MVRRAARQNPQRRQVSIGVQVPPPTGGWNARDALAAMSPQDAVILDNWVPRAGYVELRRGFIPQVTGFASPVETLLPFRGGATGSDKLYAASGGGLYDVSTLGGALGAAVISGFNSNRWNYVGFSNAAANWTIACNPSGLDAPIGCNAGAWGALPALSGSSGSIVLNPANLFNVFQHKGRLYFLEQASLRVWNPAAGAVGGACTLLDLSSVFTKGGRIVAGGNWSYQYGLTADDFAVFLTDQGQIAIYQGIDPTNASAWSLLGVFDFSPPVGFRPLIQFGGDLAVITADGVIPLSQGLKLERSQSEEVALTNKITNAFSAAVKAYGANYGWQALLYAGTSTSTLTNMAAGSLAIFNVPISTLGTSMQFVQNLVTGAWCRFLNLNAFCWELCNGNVYFGSTVGVYQWDRGANDNGIAITANVLGAYSAFGQPGRTKIFKMVRPLLNTSSLVQPALDICTDYKNVTPTAVPTVIGQGSTTPSIRYDWTGASGVGFVGAPAMQVILQGDSSIPLLGVGDANGDLLGIDTGLDTLAVSTTLPFDVPCQLQGFDLVYEVGGIIG